MTKKLPVKLYTMLNGSVLGAQEISQEDGKRLVTGICVVDTNPSQTGWSFSPLKFVDPTAEYTLHTHGIIMGETSMPKKILESYSAYVDSFKD